MTGNFKWHSCSTNDFPPKRHKVLKACEGCRSKKIKCDGLRPCQRCASNNINCEYSRTTAKRIKKKQPIESSYSSPSINSVIEEEEEQVKIDIRNDMYTLFRVDQSNKSNRFGSTLLPLLLDFFNLNSQPTSIWNKFMSCLPDQKSNLLKEAIHLFMSHNLLYSIFIHSSSSLLQSIVVDGILAITFFSAYQSLPSHQLNETLYLHAHQFYKKALVQFMEACFPTQPNEQIHDKHQIIQLIQSAVLLAHFQCQAIHEHQAYMTIRIAIDLIHRYNIIALLEDESPEERENLIALIKIVDAWHVWLSFYLKKTYTESELPPIVYKELQHNKSESQNWAFQVTEAYTLFFKNTLLVNNNKLITIQSLKENLKILSEASKPITNNTRQQQEKKNPYRMVHLYHNILTIQILHHHFDRIESQEDIDYTVRSSQNIIATVNKIFDSNSKATIHHPDYSLALIYAICQVYQLLSKFFEKNKKLMQENALRVLYIQLLKFLRNGAPYFQSFNILFTKLTEEYDQLPSPLLRQLKKNQVPPSPSPSSSSDIAPPIIAAATSEDLSSYQDNLLQHELLLAESNQLMRSALPSRTDIDREQLDKLSKPPNQQKLEQYYCQQQQLLPSSNYLFTKYISATGIIPSFTTTLGKRNEEMMNEYYYHYQQPSKYYPNKRLRSDTVNVTTNKDETINSNPPSGHTRPRHHSMPTAFMDVNEMATTEPQHSDAFMYLLMDENETNFYNDQQQLYNPKKRHLHDSNLTTKLPLPQPSKPAPMLKTWSATSNPSHFWSSTIFQESEVQTLHYPAPPMMNFEPSSFPIGLNVIHEDDQPPPQQQQQQLLYPNSQHRSSIISDKSSISSKGDTTIAEVETEAAAEAAAAAAAASWAVAVEIHQQQNKKKPRDRTTPSHWIDTEKVPDEEDYWPNS